jgi:hypothetical protein
VSFASLAEPLGAGRRPRNLDDGKE